MSPVTKRTFTHEIQAAIIGPYGTNTTVLAAAQFVAQEDIKIVGIHLVIGCSLLGNDGWGEVWAEVSQNGDRYQPGIIIEAGAYSTWNTSPAFGQAKSLSTNVMFAPGHEITLREEGVLYLHTTAFASGVTAGNLNGSAHAIIFYQKA